MGQITPIFTGFRQWSAVVALAAVAVAGPVSAQSSDLSRAQALYLRTEYDQAEQIAKRLPKSADSLLLLGRIYYGQQEYKESTETLEEAAKLRPNSSEIHLWLGRAFGRRAENANFFNVINQARWATNAREEFEKAFELDPRNLDAAEDLMEFYLQAPSIMGGGADKAQAMQAKIYEVDRARGERAAARISEHNGNYTTAENHLQAAVKAEPSEPGHLIALATLLARRNRIEESEQAFEKAREMKPGNPELLYGRASIYIEQKRNLATARELLESYLKAQITPEDPSREDARELLERAR